MAKFSLSFNLKNNFQELPEIFRVINTMLYYKKASKIRIQVEEFEADNYFLWIRLYRCRPSVPAVEVKRDLEPGSLPSKEALKIFQDLLDNCNGYPYFEATDNKKVVVKFYDNIQEYERTEFRNQPKKVITIKSDPEILLEELLNIKFKLRKPFTELSELTMIGNTMLDNGAFCFLSIETKQNSNGGFSYLLNISYYFRSITRASLIIRMRLYNYSAKESIFLLESSNYASSAGAKIMMNSSSEIVTNSSSPVEQFLNISVLTPENVTLKYNLVKQFEIFASSVPK